MDLRPYAGAPTPLAMPFRRTIEFPSYGLGSIDAGGSYSFQLSDLPNYTEFTNLFDRFCIDSVDVVWTLVKHTSGQPWPTLWFSKDYEDAVAPTFSGIQQRENVEALAFNDTKTKFVRRIKPRTAIALYNGVTSSYAVGPASTWINTAYSGTPHYGYKFWLENYNSTSSAGSSLTVAHVFNFRCRLAS